MSSTADIIKTLTAKFNAAAAAGLDLVFQFNIEDAENYYVTVKDGTCEGDMMLAMKLSELFPV